MLHLQSPAMIRTIRPLYYFYTYWSLSLSQRFGIFYMDSKEMRTVPMSKTSVAWRSRGAESWRDLVLAPESSDCVRHARFEVRMAC